MNLNSMFDAVSRDKLHFITRVFGWAVLAHFVTWMVSNILTHSYGWPGAASLFGDDANIFSFIQFLAYPLMIGLAVGWVLRSGHIGLRQDAARISDFNAVLVRWAFFAVLFIGVADMAISFLRVEGLLESVVGKDLTIALGRSAYRGPWVHVPLMVRFCLHPRIRFLKKDMCGSTFFMPA